MPKNRTELAAIWPPTFILRTAFNRHGARLHGKFVVTLDGPQLCISRRPLLDAARVLLADGVDPETPIATRHAGSDFDAMTSTVETAARWTVKENEIQSPHFVRWEAFPASRVRPSLRSGSRFASWEDAKAFVKNLKETWIPPGFIKGTGVRRVEVPPNVFLDLNTKQAVPFAERDEADTLDSDGRAA